MTHSQPCSRPDDGIADADPLTPGDSREPVASRGPADPDPPTASDPPAASEKSTASLAEGESEEPIELLESGESVESGDPVDSSDEVVDGVAVTVLSESESESESESDPPRPFDRLPPDPMLHWVYLGMALGVILLSVVLRVEGEERVVVPFFNKPLPGTCTFKRITGLGCPGCGLTRSFVSLARGDVVRAWHFNPVGLGVAVLVVTQVPYRILQLVRIRRGLPEFRAGRLMNWTFLLLAVGLFLQWIWRLSAGGP